MSGICPTCGANGYIPEDKPRQDPAAFSIGVTPGMKSTAFIMLKHERCKEDWKRFLQDLQGRAYITEKQKKFYNVIHKEVLGAWPPRDEAPAPPPPEDDGSVPF